MRGLAAVGGHEERARVCGHAAWLCTWRAARAYTPRARASARTAKLLRARHARGPPPPPPHAQDEFVNMVLEDVVEYSGERNADGSARTQRLEAMLLNGAGVVSMVPGSSPEEAAARFVGPKPR